MVRMTCVLYRKPGTTPAEFHEHWRTVHGPLVVSTRSGGYVLRYEQHPRPLDDYTGEDDPGPDGVTVQWFDSIDAYNASVAEPDFARIWEDVTTFLDVSRLVPVLTEEPVVVVDRIAGATAGS